MGRGGRDLHHARMGARVGVSMCGASGLEEWGRRHGLPLLANNIGANVVQDGTSNRRKHRRHESCQASAPRMYNTHPMCTRKCAESRHPLPPHPDNGDANPTTSSKNAGGTAASFVASPTESMSINIVVVVVVVVILPVYVTDVVKELVEVVEVAVVVVELNVVVVRVRVVLV